MKLQLSCCNCGHYSNTYEPLIDVSLVIKDVGSLHSASESFSRVEKLDDPEIKFSCEKCKARVSIEKQLMFDGSVVQKVDKHVSFPLELDFPPYSDHNNQTNNEEMKFLGFIYYVLCKERHSVVSDVNESNVAADETVQASNPGPTGVINSSDSHELNKIVDKEMNETVQTHTPGSPSAINSSNFHAYGMDERYRVDFPDQVASENQLHMDPVEDTEIKLALSLIKKRVSRSSCEELMAALRRSDW
ncbi:hypothetical protein CQW23_18658 [Capsicum baccatum]|uniref:USP domain-containing protein n=1 Tax=Capsicum baccatum TaxID=33114 RepID=A0A2G2W3K3_CAPBA|nr:hypothetical protein CQW23_18658 [Capsicum baccatum]